MKFARFVVGVSALAFLGFGTAFLVAPETLVGTVALQPTDPIGLTEIRAFYGGLEIGLAVFLLACLFGDRRDLLAATSAVAMTMAAVAIARGWGMFMDDTAGTLMAGFMATELVFAAAALLARARLRAAA